jgi:predicted Zn-dependent protease
MIARLAHRMLLVLPLAALVACSERPQAPPLTAEAVFQYEEIGLRFLAPAGWPIQSRAVLPTGPLRKPIVLVAYQKGAGEKPAEFKLVVADVSPETNLDQFLSEYRVGTEQWVAVPPTETVTINNAEATRHLQRRTQAKDEIRREVTAFRRGGRVYLFLVVFAATDGGSRDAVRTAVGSVAWTK